MPSRRTMAILCAVIVGTGIIVAAFYLPSLCPDCVPLPPTSSKAAIIDQLDLSAPNATFRQDVAGLFQKAMNVTPDVFVGPNVTVNFYRTLPSRGYRLILLRVHSGLLHPIAPSKPVYLFTGELYSETKYQREVLNGELTPASVTPNSPVYFSIGPLFVKRDMNGTFPGTVLIISGCSALINTHLADEFLKRGVSAVISWDEFVSATWTDYAVFHLMEDFLLKGMTVKQAVDDTMNMIGPDPYFNSNLRFYPDKAANITLSQIMSQNWPPQTATAASAQRLEMDQYLGA